MSIFTLLMTVPQVLTIWVGQQAAGVSVWSRSSCLVSALLWFWSGIQKRDKNIYLPCVGWMAPLKGGSMIHDRPFVIGGALTRRGLSDGQGHQD